MKDLSALQLAQYTVEARLQVVDWLQANWASPGPLRARLDQLPPTSVDSDRPLPGVGIRGDCGFPQS